MKSGLRAFKFVWRTVEVLAFIVLIFYVAFIFIQRASNNGDIMGYRMFTVATGSMEPEIHTGDVVIVKTTALEDLKVGDVVTYMGEINQFDGMLITHKIIDIETEEDGSVLIHTKGVANEIEDEPIRYPQIYGKVIYKTVIISFINRTINTQAGFFFLIFVPIVVFIMLEVLDIMFQNKLDKKEIEARQEAIRLNMHQVDNEINGPSPYDEVRSVSDNGYVHDMNAVSSVSMDNNNSNNNSYNDTDANDDNGNGFNRDFLMAAPVEEVTTKTNEVEENTQINEEVIETPKVDAVIPTLNILSQSEPVQLEGNQTISSDVGNTINNGLTQKQQSLGSGIPEISDVKINNMPSNENVSDIGVSPSIDMSVVHEDIPKQGLNRIIPSDGDDNKKIVQEQPASNVPNLSSLANVTLQTGDGKNNAE